MWYERYLGIPYSGEADCAALVERVMRERFGVRVQLPSSRDWRCVGPERVRSLAEPVAESVTVPRDGDMALMRTVGARQGHAHVGLMVCASGSLWVLHSTIGWGSHLTRLRHLGMEQLRLLGYYRALTHQENPHDHDQRPGEYSEES